ncbi:uncharacterized protein LOC128625855 [Artibeus jamaicensis]|uniref:uncharacterized protein LOC128625855 n=1 Tax=Artibeus jamaicensis TaxID=9417 RepID=UPI00235ADA7F|nr:uncharacterized protein LOC128625855 [Artibeus jamaicensis]
MEGAAEDRRHRHIGASETLWESRPPALRECRQTDGKNSRYDLVCVVCAGPTDEVAEKSQKEGPGRSPDSVSALPGRQQPQETVAVARFRASRIVVACVPHQGRQGCLACPAPVDFSCGASSARPSGVSHHTETHEEHAGPEGLLKCETSCRCVWGRCFCLAGHFRGQEQRTGISAAEVASCVQHFPGRPPRAQRTFPRYLPVTFKSCVFCGLHRKIGACCLVGATPLDHHFHLPALSPDTRPPLHLKDSFREFCGWSSVLSSLHQVGRRSCLLSSDRSSWSCGLGAWPAVPCVECPAQAPPGFVPCVCPSPFPGRPPTCPPRRRQPPGWAVASCSLCLCSTGVSSLHSVNAAFQLRFRKEWE